MIRLRSGDVCRWLVSAAMFVAAMDAADLPIERMEASTVRVFARLSDGVGTGSGFVVGDGSYVATNYHVVKGAQQLLVAGKGIKIAATVAVFDPAKDLAILRLDQNAERPAAVLALRSTVSKT